MVVRAEDLVAGKALCQLGLATPEVVRGALRALAKAEDSPAATLLNLLMSRGALDKVSRARVQRYAKLYQSARSAALEVALVKQNALVPDAVVDSVLAEVERARFDRTVTQALVAAGELGPAQAQRLEDSVARTLGNEDRKVVESYSANDYEGVSRSLTKDRKALLDTGQFTVKKLFRSKESQRLARQTSLADTVTEPAPLPPTRKVDPPRPGVQAAFDPAERTSELDVKFARLGPYLVLHKLGQGSCGPVFLARRPDLAKPVALKVGEEKRRDEAFTRFKRAAALARDVRHEALVAVIDQAEHDGFPVLALELISGESLRSEISREAPFGEGRALALANDLLSALVAVHAAGLVHADLTPEGILVSTQTGQSRARVGDLGRSLRAGERRVPLREPRSAYAAPEQLAGEKLDARSDLYAVGLVVYEALTGTFPFERRSLDELEEHKLGLVARSLGQGRPDKTFSPAVEELVARLLSRDRAERPPSAARALKALDEVVLPRLGRASDTARIGALFDQLFRG